MKKSSLSSLLLVLLVILSNSVWAYPGHLKAFTTQYPQVLDSQLNSCSTCHYPVKEEFLNAYGLDLKRTGGGIDFKKVESLDSDEDGVLNIHEIENGFFPGSKATSIDFFLFTNPRGNIRFDHSKHMVFPNYGSSGKCENCHGGEVSFPQEFNDSISIRKEGHSICLKCHRESGSQNAPLQCGGCHKGSIR